MFLFGALFFGPEFFLHGAHFGAPVLFGLGDLFAGEALGGGFDGGGVAQEDVELTVAIEIIGPDAGGSGGGGIPVTPDGFAAVLAGDEFPEFGDGDFFSGAGGVFGPLGAAIGVAGEDVEVAIGIDIDAEGVGVVAVDGELEVFGFGVELAVALSAEEEEGAFEVPDEEVEVAIGVPVDGGGSGADALGDGVVV